jgi:Tfp pilus assembly protein PilO
VNRRLLIPLGAGVAVVLLWFVALWGPQSSALSDARKRADDAVQQRGTLRDQVTRLQQSRRDLPLKQSQLETLRVAIPDDPNLAQFILDANDAASRAGIEFLSVSPTPPAASTPTPTPTTPTTTAGAGGGATPTTVAAAGSAGAAGAAAAPAAPASIKIAMIISGGYYQVLDFVNRLNKLPRIVVVDGLTLASSPANAQLQVNLQARMFTTTPKSFSGTGGAGGTAPGATTTTTGAGGSATTTTSSGR